MVGTASMLSRFVAGAARSAVNDLAELALTPVRSGGEAEAKLRAALAAATAWLETYMECEALEWYTFEPPYDPADPIL